MNDTNKRSWGHEIRWYIYKMLILLSVMALLAIGYRYWYENHRHHINAIANDFHLTSTFHYLKAMEELRHIQGHLLIEKIGHSTAGKLQVQLHVSNNLENYSMLLYVIQQEIQAGLQLQKEFTDNRFFQLTEKLKGQLFDYTGSQEEHLKNLATVQALEDNLRSILTTLNQLVRLHTVVRVQRLDEISDFESQQTILFYLLLLILGMTGMLMTHRGLLAINLVIDKYQEAQDTIRHQAHYDTLTNLPNRFLVLDRLERRIVEAQRNNEKCAVIFLDLDDFKKINDTMGHDVGDQLLIEAARRLSNSVRSRDTVGRLGGDEFVIILDELKDNAYVHAIVENMIRQLRTIYKIDSRELLVTVSIGISIYPGNGDNSIELLRNADSAMYHSKKLGRNTFSYFTNSMNYDNARRLALEEQMHKALELNEFSLMFQPQVELESNKIMGAEALLRWHNSQLGSITPEEFIPIAEQTGLIVSIGEFVINEALRFTSKVQKQLMYDFRIAVNISPRQFREPLLVKTIKKMTMGFGISFEDLELEITEGVLMGGHTKIFDTLQELTGLGIKIAMDDFGTGYSSLSYLRQYPFHVLKVDRSFVNDITKSSAGRELINASIKMAHGLKLKVVAEGVETSEQLAFLKDLSCDYAQGYLFGKPLSENDFCQLLESSRSNHTKHTLRVIKNND